MEKLAIFLHRFNYLIMAILVGIISFFIINKGVDNAPILITMIFLVVFIGHNLLLDLFISLIKYPVNNFGNPDRCKISDAPKGNYGWYKKINDNGTCDLTYYYKVNDKIKILVEHKQVKLYDTIYK